MNRDDVVTVTVRCIAAPYMSYDEEPTFSIESRAAHDVAQRLDGAQFSVSIADYSDVALHRATRDENATLRGALRRLLDDVEGGLDFGCPFEDPNNNFHEGVMAARKALGRE